ncbi:MAG: hypothetical protein ABIQ02_13780 [Saprospiraceae bacterium]
MKPRSYANGVTLSLSLARTVGSLVPVYKKEKSDLKMICPVCTTPNLVEQRYVCSEGHGPFFPGDCTGRVKIINKSLVPVDVESLPVPEKTGAGPSMEINVHPLEQVERSTWSLGNAYSFQPEFATDPFFGVLCDLVCEDDLAFVGEMVIRNATKLFRLIRAPQGLILDEICYPESLYQYENLEPQYDSKFLMMALDLTANQLCDFDPSNYVNKKKAALTSMIENVEPSKIHRDPRQQMIDIEEMLASSLAKRS